MLENTSYIPYDFRWKNYREPLMLAFTAGFIDAAGLLSMGIFICHITGNLIFSAVRVAGGDFIILARIISIFVFIIASALASLTVRYFLYKKKNPLGFMFMLEGFFMFLCMLSGILLAPVKDSDSFAIILTVTFGVCAMGIRVSTNRLLFSKVPISTVMSGNTAQVAVDLLTLVLTKTKFSSTIPSEDTIGALSRTQLLFPFIIAFFVGAAFGAYGFHFIHYYCFFIPAFLVFILGVKEELYSNSHSHK